MNARVGYFVEVKQSEGKVDYIATLDGGQQGITAQDIAGRDVPGFDQLKLDKVTVTNDNLVADLEFAKVKGEIAAFHPGGFDKAVLAVSLEKLGFGDLVPLPQATPLDGVSVDKLTMMVVPDGKTLKPSDEAIPQVISDNIAKVLSDLSKSEPGRDTKPIDAGITMMAELDIKGAGGVETLMASAGFGETILPIAGTMSSHLFDVKADPKLKLKGVSLSMALPKVSIPGLPSSIKITKPVFNISDIVPPSISKLDPPSLPEVGPYTTIGLDLAMRALGKTHQFDALMLIGKDISNKMVVDLVGRAVDPNGFFDFKGLQATTLDLASVSYTHLTLPTNREV